MIIVKTAEEIELMRQSALIVSKTLGMLAKETKEGVTTNHLDKIAEEFIRVPAVALLTVKVSVSLDSLVLSVSNGKAIVADV